MPESSVFPSQVQEPKWVTTDATVKAGLDLLGLRLPAQAIGGRLFNGITTITPTIRYLSLRTWLIDRYINAPEPQPDSSRAFVRYARAGEAAFVLANLHRNPSTLYLIGSDWGRDQIRAEEDVIQLSDLWKQRAVNTYARPSDQLRLTVDRGTGVPALGRERGVPLAKTVEELFGRTQIGRRLSEGRELDVLFRDEVEELAQVAWADEIPDSERECLLNAIIPPQPLPDERSRVATYALLLELARIHHGQTLEEDHLWLETVMPLDRVAQVLAPTLDGWLNYLIRDMIAVTGEAALQGVVETLREVAGPYGTAEDLAVVTALVSKLDLHASALQEVGLLSDSEDPSTLTFRDLETRVADLTPGQPSALGLMRWPGGLDEIQVISAAQSRGAASISLLLVSWILADRRAGAAAREGHQATLELSYRGSERFGLADIIIPALERWRAKDLLLPEVLAEIVFLVLEQHLRIAWSRLSVDIRNDVAVLIREGAQWIHRKDYTGGRTAARLWEAIHWLHQLRLVDETGLTSAGTEVLSRSIRALEEQAQ